MLGKTIDYLKHHNDAIVRFEKKALLATMLFSAVTGFLRYFTFLHDLNFHIEFIPPVFYYVAFFGFAICAVLFYIRKALESSLTAFSSIITLPCWILIFLAEGVDFFRFIQWCVKPRRSRRGYKRTGEACSLRSLLLFNKTWF